MRRSNKPLSQALILALLAQPLLTVVAAEPAAAEESTATTVLQGVTSTLQGANGVMSTIQASNAQLNQLYGQFTQLNNQTAGVQTGLSALEQTKQELALALATAQTCVSTAESKKTTNMARYKKATISSATAFVTQEPSCKNYGNIVDSGRKLADQLTSAMEKNACLIQLQNTLGTVANKAKVAFTQAQQAATEVYNTRTSIITNYENMAKRIDGDLNGKDGQGGYKKQLADLKALSADLYQKVNSGMAAGKDGQGQGGGFATRLRAVKASRTKAANGWYQSFMGQVNQCFTSTPLPCRAGLNATPLNCIAESLGSGTGTGAGYTGRVNAIQRAQGAANIEALRRTLGMNSQVMSDTSRLANLDVKNEAEFLSYTNQQFDKMVGQVVNNFRNQRFYGNNVNQADLGNFVKAQYSKCYEIAAADFKSDMAGEGGRYKDTLRGVEETEAGLNAEIKGMLDDTQNKMNEFRTSFNKIYNSDLPQFSSDCSASDDPYQSLDCLRMLSANLKSGIEGTAQTVKLETKLAATGLKQFTAQPPSTVMTLQNLSLDPTSGKPTLGSSTTSCVGFNECVNVLDRTLTHYNDQKTSQETARKEFVDTHNKSIQTSLGTVAAQFTQVSTLFDQEVAKLKGEMSAAGVAAVLKTKQVEGEALVANEKTGLFDTPKDMKAAIAAQGAYSELDDPAATQEAVKAQAKEVAAKVNEALKKKNECLVKQADYKAIANSLDCSEKRVCRGDNFGRALTPLQAVMHKSSSNPEAGARDEITREYNSCVSRSRSATDPNSQDRDDINDNKDENIRKELRRTKRKESREYQGEERKACLNTALGQIDAKIADSSSETASENNSAIISALRSIDSACPETDGSEDKPDYSDAVSACEKAKRSIEGKTPPPALDTDVNSSSSGATFTNPLSNSSSAK